MYIEQTMNKLLTKALLTLPGKGAQRGLLVMFMVTALAPTLYAVTKTSTGNGNWSASATWSPSGVPATDDDIIIRSGDIVTVDGSYTCNNLTIGNNTNADGILQITSASNSLTITGDLQINPLSKNKTFTLDAGPGTININGTFSVWGYGPSSSLSGIQVGSGTINVTPAITISNSKQSIIFTGAGTITFNGAYTNQVAGLVTFAGCTVNYKNSVTISSTASNWNGKGTAVFWNGSSITPSASVTFNNIQINTSASVTLNSAAGAVSVTGSVMLESGSVFTTNKDIEVNGDWTNNGGTFSGTNDTLTLNGSSGTIGGTSSTSFRVLRIGRNSGTTAVSYTMNTDNTCNFLRLSTGSAARTLTLASGKTLTVNNDVTINQPTSSVTSLLAVNSGACNISGSLTFSGTNSTATRVAQVTVTSGALSVTGSVNWMSNSEVATEVITVSTGTVTFGSSITMGSNSGTLTCTGTGSVNFNGTTAPSFTFGGSSAAPVFTAASGSTLSFMKGFTNNTTAISLANTTTVFTGSGTVTPTAAITFGNVQINSGATVTLAGNITVSGNWTNNGGTLSGGSNTVILDGTSAAIGGSSSTSFPTLRIGKASGGNDVNCTININTTTNYLNIDGNAQPRTLTINSGVTLTVNNDATLNQPAGNSITNSLNVNAGTCNISGNLVFSGTGPTTSKIARVAVTSGVLNITGNVTWMSNTVSETEVITVSTGTITFGTSITMGSASGTVAVTGTGTINFNGTSVPSLTFGGATAPVLTTSSGCTVNFEKGFTTVTTSLAFASGSNINVGSVSSATHFTIDPGTTVTNNGTTIVYGNLTSTSASTFVNGANATLELRGAVSANVTLTATATGNTVSYKGGSDQTVKPTTYYNLILDNAGTKSCASGVAVNNNLTVQGAAVISNSVALTVTGTFTYASSAASTLGNNLTAYGLILSSGTLNDGGNTITINNSTGWTKNGGTFTSTGTVAFTGSTASIIGGTQPTTFNTLNINNPAGVTLGLSPAAATIVSGSLMLTNGLLNTSSTSILKLSDNATSGSGSLTSYVNGPMVKVGDDDFIFPIGKSGLWSRVKISGLISTATEVSAEFFRTGYEDVTTLSSELTQVSNSSYWMIDRTVTTDPVKLRFYWENAAWSDVMDCQYLTIAHYKGGQWEKEPATVVSGSSCSQATGGTGSIETDGYVSSFSPFGFGGSGGTALPIKLVSFDAFAKDNVVETSWTTEIEINNDYFTVERSVDGINFTEMSRIGGAGNSTSLLRYVWVDENPLPGISYYRLKQTDFDGQFSYSGIVAVTVTGKQIQLSLYPNPTQGDVFVRISSPSEKAEVTIYDITGRVLYSKYAGSGNGINQQAILVSPAGSLPPGTYVVSVVSSGVEKTERLVVNSIQQ